MLSLTGARALQNPGSENKDINMALVTYNIRPDNAKLGSFGSIADVRKNIVRSNARDVEGEIVAEKEVRALRRPDLSCVSASNCGSRRGI